MDAIATTSSIAASLRAKLDFRSQTGTEESQHARRRGNDYQPLEQTNRRGRCEDGSCGPQSDLRSAQQLSYYRSEKSVLKIRTQEGDIVSLRIRVGESAKFSASKSGDAEQQVSEIKLATRQSTRVSLNVKGDLNADELAAIKSVFEQSAALADEFFGGDYAAAFKAAGSLEIDAQQLAKVSLRLKVREALTYSASALPASLFGSPATKPAQPVGVEQSPSPAPAPAAKPVSEAAAADQAAAVPAETAVAPVVPAVEPDVVAQSEPVETAAEAEQAPATASTSGFWFAAVLEFVGRIIETFESVEPAAAESPESDEAATPVEINLSLKLRIFSSLLVQIANSGEAASETEEPPLPALVPETIEAVATENDAPLEAVA